MDRQMVLIHCNMDVVDVVDMDNRAYEEDDMDK
jgi:hypothetical protein